MASKTLFVTVGTTRFDKLVTKITEPATLKELVTRGFTKIILQYGKGNFEPPQDNKGLLITSYSLKESLEEDIEKADLIISHAGAGSCLEVLRAGKPLVVVVNEDLMDNHQSELADALSSRNHAFSCTVTSLIETLKNLVQERLEPYPPPDPDVFCNFLDRVMEIKS